MQTTGRCFLRLLHAGERVHAGEGGLLHERVRRPTRQWAVTDSSRWRRRACPPTTPLLCLTRFSGPLYPSCVCASRLSARGRGADSAGAVRGAVGAVQRLRQRAPDHQAAGGCARAAGVPRAGGGDRVKLEMRREAVQEIGLRWRRASPHSLRAAADADRGVRTNVGRAGTTY